MMVLLILASDPPFFRPEDQTEDEQFAEIEAAHEAEGTTLMAVPTELVPEVRALLARTKSE